MKLGSSLGLSTALILASCYISPDAMVERVEDETGCTAKPIDAENGSTVCQERIDELDDTTGTQATACSEEITALKKQADGDTDSVFEGVSSRCVDQIMMCIDGGKNRVSLYDCPSLAHATATQVEETLAASGDCYTLVSCEK